jgi:dTDP-4-dehydrorhamnose 3,5-epimerase
LIEGVEYFNSIELPDSRGSFSKLFSKNWENLSSMNTEEMFLTTSIKGVTRGMHLQIGLSENWKIVSVVEGYVFDVLVDVRKSSNSFLNINEYFLESGMSLLLPPGVAHGFQAVESSKLLYLSSKARVEELDVGFNVQSLPINWPLDFGNQSERDMNLPSLNLFLSK